jgi:hypothetical protein
MRSNLFIIIQLNDHLFINIAATVLVGVTVLFTVPVTIQYKSSRAIWVILNLAEDMSFTAPVSIQYKSSSAI